MKRTVLLLSCFFCILACTNAPRINTAHIVPADTVSTFRIFETKSFWIKSDSAQRFFIKTDSEMVADWYNDTVYLTAITEGIHRLQVFKSKTDQSLLDTVLTAFKNPIIKANWFPFQEHHGPAFTSDHEYGVYSNMLKFHYLNKPFPDFRLITSHSLPIDNSIFKNHITLINFWYYGCTPCIYELPYLNELADSFKTDPSVQFYSFFNDSIFVRNDSTFFTTRISSTEGKVKPQYHYNSFIQVPNCMNFSRSMLVFSFPANILIDSNGIIRFLDFGASLNKKDEDGSILMMKEQINELKTKR